MTDPAADMITALYQLHAAFQNSQLQPPEIKLHSFEDGYRLSSQLEERLQFWQTKSGGKFGRCEIFGITITWPTGNAPRGAL